MVYNTHMAKKLYLTARPGKTYKSVEEIKHDWHDGQEFRVYGGYLTSIHKTVEMKMGGIVFVEVVFQNPDHGMRAESTRIML